MMRFDESIWIVQQLSEYTLAADGLVVFGIETFPVVKSGIFIKINSIYASRKPRQINVNSLMGPL